MNLGKKVPLAFAMALLLTSLFGAVGFWIAQQALDTFHVDVIGQMDDERTVASMEGHFKTQVQEWKDVLLRGMDAALLEKHWAAFQREEAAVQADATTLKSKLRNPALVRDLDGFVVQHQTMARGYRDGFEKFKAAGLEPSVGDMVVRGIDREPAKRLRDLKTAISLQSAAVAEQAFVNGQAAIRWSSGLMLFSILIGVWIGVVISRAVVRPLKRAINIAQDVAQGNLSRDIAASGSDETAQLLRALAGMQTQLRELVSQVRQNADYVASASAEIAKGNQHLASRTEQQACALQLTASSMKELGAAVGRNADSAGRANGLALDASMVAATGGQVVNQVVDTMNAINEASRKVSEIIGVIDGIAFQTNILALNAAVEAARAGDQGRGFAVVASEVRSLAQRSAGAAREIKSLINASVERVEAGSVLANRAGESMQDVVAAIEKVTTVIAEISHASGEQLERVTQVGLAVNQIDQGTQQNAALVEQTSASAESLHDKADMLVATVGQFRIAPSP